MADGRLTWTETVFVSLITTTYVCIPTTIGVLATHFLGLPGWWAVPFVLLGAFWAYLWLCRAVPILRYENYRKELLGLRYTDPPTAEQQQFAQEMRLRWELNRDNPLDH